MDSQTEFMRINHDYLADLRKNLPRGSPSRIRDKLKAKGINYSRQYILRCLDPDHPAYNRIIIDEAVLLVEEDAAHKNQLYNRLDELNQPQP